MTEARELALRRCGGTVSRNSANCAARPSVTAHGSAKLPAMLSEPTTKVPDANFCWFLVRAPLGIVGIPGFRDIEAGPNRREISNT
jgi:hypothetical protein